MLALAAPAARNAEGNAAPSRRSADAAPGAKADSAKVDEPARAATQLRSVRIGKIDNGYSVTLAGNGLLAASKVDAADTPHRVFLDFRNVAVWCIA